MTTILGILAILFILFVVLIAVVPHPWLALALPIAAILGHRKGLP